IETVFGPVPSGIHLTADTRHGNDAAVAMLLVIATVSVILRMTSRFIASAGIRSDNLIMVFALVSSLLCPSVRNLTRCFLGTAYGAGTHVWTLTIPKVLMIYKILFGYTFVYAAAVSSTKISILFFYYRLFQKNSSLIFSVCLGLGGFLAAAYPIIVWTTMSKACQPTSFFWEQFTGADGICPVDISNFFLALGVINMINDILVLLIPIPRIWKLNTVEPPGITRLLTRINMNSVCVASTVRINYLTVFMNATDVTYVMGPVFIWSSAEPSIGILSACMLTFPTLVRWPRRKATT
ncbi:hypothetical protein M406DRAFT_220421, partial [Cryphonectria parasitica EP155]